MASSAFTLLLVDHMPRNLQLLEEFLGKEGYQTIGASTYAEFDQALIQHQESIHGALIDIAGFDPHIWERCERLRAAKIPFLVVSAQMSAAIQAAGLAHGAKSVMKKPLVIKDLVAIIKSILIT